MNFKILGLSAFLTFIAVIAGCSGSGRNLSGGGRYCNIRSFDGFENPGKGTEVISKFSKSENKGTPDEVISAANLPEGTYELTVADFMYLRKVEPDNPRRWMMTQVRQDIDAREMRRQKNETGEDSETLYKSQRYCVGGYRKGDSTYEASMTGITKIVVSAGGKIEFETTSLGYRFNSEKPMVEELWLEKLDNGVESPTFSKPEDSSKYSAPKDVFDTGSLETLSLRKLPSRTDEVYQIYTRQDLDGGTTFQFLRVTLKKKKEENLSNTDEEVPGNSDEQSEE